MQAERDIGKQWEKKALPYWTKQNKFAEDHGVKVAIEMHPGLPIILRPPTGSRFWMLPPKRDASLASPQIGNTARPLKAACLIIKIP